MARIHGGRVIARTLKNEGVDTVFTLTGGHIVPILDGCVDEGIRIVDFRHEQAATHAAEAWNRLTGQLGVSIVTAGPGVTDAITAVATAHHSATPLLLIGGRHLVRQDGMGGLQEMDHPALFGTITAWAGTAWQTERLADSVTTAIRHAFAGRGGPVFLDVPLDVQFGDVPEETFSFPEAYRPGRPSGADAGALQQIAAALQAAQRPVIFAGTGLTAAGGRSLAALAEKIGAPTFLNGRARGALPHDHPLLGRYTRRAAFAGADVMLALGVDWDFRTGYGQTINPDATVIHIDADPTRIGWNRAIPIGIVADPGTVVEQLAEHLAPDSAGSPSWAAEIATAEHEAATAAAAEAASDEAPIHPQRFAAEVGRFFGPDAVVAVDGGDIVSTSARWLQTSTPGHVLDPGPFGSLGTGPPYAIAAQIAFPDKLVGIVFGDGGFGFNGMEYDTMVRLGLPIVGVMGNDGVWNNVKTFHEMMFPGRTVAAELGPRPYHEVVAGLGGHGELVEKADDIRPALERARESGLPALVNVQIAEHRRMSSNYSQ